MSGSQSDIPNAPYILVVPGDTILKISHSMQGISYVPHYQYSVDNSDWVDFFVPANDIYKTIIIDGLENSVSYNIKLRAVINNIAGNIAEAVGMPSTVPNSPVINNIVPHNTYLSVEFTPPDNTGKAPILYYQYSLNDAWYNLDLTNITNSSFRINQLDNGVSYSIKLRAYNVIGQSIDSEPLSGTPTLTVPETPIINNITTDDSILTVYFTIPDNGGSNITLYEYKVDNNEWVTANVVGDSFIINELENGVSYSVKMRVTNSIGSSDESSSVSGTPSPFKVPNEPMITNIIQGNTILTLYFPTPYDGGSPITSYEYKVDSNEWVVANVVESVVENYFIINNLTNYVTYTIQVRANNIMGSSNSIVTIMVNPVATIPNPPVIDSISNNDSSLKVYFTAPNDGGASIISYEYKVDENEWVNANIVENYFIINELENGVEYSIQLRANNDIGSSNASVSVSGTPVAPPTIPNPPVINSITGNNLSLKVYFTAPNDGGASIISYEYKVDENEWVTANVVENYFIINELENGVEYSIQLRANNDIGSSNASESVSGTPVADIILPNIIRIVPDGSSVLIYFNYSYDGEISNYQYTINNGSNWINTNQTSSPFTVSNISNNQIYTFMIRAVTPDGNSPSSNKLQFTNYLGSTKYLNFPIALAPSVSVAAGVANFQMNIDDFNYSAREGICYGVNVGVIGLVAGFTLNAFDAFTNNITNFSSNNITLNLTLPHANPVNSPLKIYKRQNNASFALLDPQPPGYPANVTYVGGNTWTTSLVSLSSYIIQDPGSAGAAAGGDPHLKQVDGKQLTLPNDWEYIKLYECDNIKVCGKTEFINEDIINKLHRKNKRDNSIVTLDKNNFRDKYVKRYTYFTELDIYNNNELCIKLNTMNGKIKYNNSKMFIDNISNSKAGIYSLTHHTNYEPKNYVEYCIQLYNGDYLKVGIDNFWDDINSLELFLNKNNKKEYKGEFFNHTIENLIIKN